MNKLGYNWNIADPCSYHKWDKKFGLIVWLSFIDDIVFVCSADAKESIKYQFTETIDCDDIEEMKEYIGRQVSID